MSANLPEKASPKAAVDLLSRGTLLQDKNLVTKSIENLDQFLNKDNVLLVYSSLSKCKNWEAGDFEPSAPPAHEEDQRNAEWVQGLIDSLRHNCLLVVDKNADYILKKSEIANLSYEDFLAIVGRDSLKVSDEALVYCAIYRWGVNSCMKKGMGTSAENLRSVLRELCYAPRYGLMSKKQFLAKTIEGIKGPTRSEILDEQEWRLVKFYVEEKSKNRPVQPLPHKFSSTRTAGHGKPRVLSPRSSACLTRNESLTVRRNCTATGKCERCLINLLSCWTAVFD